MAERARFISRYGNYSVGVQSLVSEHLGHRGEMVPHRPRIDAQFYPHLVTDDDFAVALQSFRFPGLPFDEETNSNVSPRYRVSAWDSEWAQQNEGWDDDQIALMIEKLRATVGVDHVELVAAPLEAPFSNYDSLSEEQILEIVEIANMDPDPIVAYERENKNRVELIDALSGVTTGDDTVVVQA